MGSNHDSHRHDGNSTRRHFLRLGVAGAAVAAMLPRIGRAGDLTRELADAVAQLEPFFTPPDQFRDVSRGNPLPHSLPEEKLREVGLTRDTWKLEVIADPANPT